MYDDFERRYRQVGARARDHGDILSRASAGASQRDLLNIVK